MEQVRTRLRVQEALFVNKFEKRITAKLGCVDRGCSVRREVYNTEPAYVFIHTSSGNREAAWELTSEEYWRIYGTPEGGAKTTEWLRSVHEYEDRRKAVHDAIK